MRKKFCGPNVGPLGVGDPHGFATERSCSNSGMREQRMQS